jgi:hypothetical protein
VRGRVSERLGARALETARGEAARRGEAAQAARVAHLCCVDEVDADVCGKGQHAVRLGLARLLAERHRPQRHVGDKQVRGAEGRELAGGRGEGRGAWGTAGAGRCTAGAGARAPRCWGPARGRAAAGAPHRDVDVGGRRDKRRDVVGDARRPRRAARRRRRGGAAANAAAAARGVAGGGGGAAAAAPQPARRRPAAAGDRWRSTPRARQPLRLHHGGGGRPGPCALGRPALCRAQRVGDEWGGTGVLPGASWFALYGAHLRVRGT